MTTIPTRIPFQHQGETIYEWEQSLEEIRIFIHPPPGIKAKDLVIDIQSNQVKVGLKNKPPFLNHKLFSTIVVSLSTWSFQDGEIEISLHKMKKAETWLSVFEGHTTLNPIEIENVKKQMTLQRFGEEHAGFDFSGAEFSGTAPDPREFMGGLKYS
jgi:hypothetical protein